MKAVSLHSNHLKVLLVGDASNCHHTLAVGLRRLGHHVTVASDGSTYMRTRRDFDLNRRYTSKFGGILYFLRLQWLFRTRFKEYDVVSIINPNFLWLRPARIKTFFKLLKKNNRSIFITASCTDSNFIEECLDTSSKLSYNEYRNGDKLLPYAFSADAKSGLEKSRKAVEDYIYAGLDGGVAVLYEYEIALRRKLPEDRIAYGGIPIDLSDIPVPKIVYDWPVRICLGWKDGKEDCKGYEYMRIAAERLVKKYPDKCSFEILRNLPRDEYNNSRLSCHIMLDQVYSYTPATNALESMAMGATVLSGAEPAFFEYIHDVPCDAICNAMPDVVHNTQLLERLVLNPDILDGNAKSGRDFVVRNNSCEVVAARFVDHWKKVLRLKYET